MENDLAVEEGLLHLIRISRPQAALKLYAAATADSGTGSNLGVNADTFTFSQALALTYFRLSVPLAKITVRGPDLAAAPGTAPGSVVYPGFLPKFRQVNIPDQDTPSVAGAVLRTFLQKAQIIKTP